MDISVFVAIAGVIQKLEEWAAGRQKLRREEAESLIQLLRTQVELLQAENGRLDERARRLEKEVAEMEANDLKGLRWYRGLRFRILPSGKMDRAIFCPRCKTPLEFGSLDTYSDLDPLGDRRQRFSLHCAAMDCGWSTAALEIPGSEILAGAARAYAVEVVD